MVEPIRQLPRIILDPHGDVEEESHLMRTAILELQKLQNLMKFQNLKQDTRRVIFPNGSIITAQSVFGQDTISIYVPPGAIPTEEIIELEMEEITCIPGWAYPKLETVNVSITGGSFSGSIAQVKRPGDFGLLDCVMLEYKNFNTDEFGGWIELSHPGEGAETWNWTIPGETNGRYAIRAKKYNNPVEYLRGNGMLDYAIPTRIETVILPKSGGTLDDNSEVTPEDDVEWIECQLSKTGDECPVNYYIVKSVLGSRATTDWDATRVLFMRWIKENKEVELEQGLIDETRTKITTGYNILDVYGIWDNPQRNGTDYSTGASWEDNEIALTAPLADKIDTIYVDYTVDPTCGVFWQTSLFARGALCSRYGMAQDGIKYLPSAFFTTCWQIADDNYNEWVFGKVSSVAGLPKYSWKIEQSGYTYVAVVSRNDDQDCSGGECECVGLGD